MALTWLQRVELALFAAAFLCGAVAAAAVTRTQVRLRGGPALGPSRLALGTGRGSFTELGTEKSQTCLLARGAGHAEPIRVQDKPVNKFTWVLGHTGPVFAFTQCTNRNICAKKSSIVE
ncbi:Transmembrane protein 179B [Cricetulus griseus]|uniref:Transmembrane protein 179B n=1 Tax=Cricetulus griseus TaxID=10029 RepID=G3II30_CRIGR|nr:Transmembrane protein 179B [Cricetulus griseus]